MQEMLGSEAVPAWALQCRISQSLNVLFCVSSQQGDVRQSAVAVRAHGTLMVWQWRLVRASCWMRCFRWLASSRRWSSVFICLVAVSSACRLATLLSQPCFSCVPCFFSCQHTTSCQQTTHSSVNTQLTLCSPSPASPAFPVSSSVNTQLAVNTQLTHLSTHNSLSALPALLLLRFLLLQLSTYNSLSCQHTTHSPEHTIHLAVNT